MFVTKQSDDLTSVLKGRVIPNSYVIVSWWCLNMFQEICQLTADVKKMFHKIG